MLDVRKFSSDSSLAGMIPGGGKMKFRWMFEVLQNAKLQTLQIGAHSGRKWAIDISGN